MKISHYIREAFPSVTASSVTSVPGYVLWLANVPSGRHISVCGTQASETCGSRGAVSRIENIHCAKETCCDWPNRTSAFDGCLQPWNRRCAYISVSPGWALHQPGAEGLFL